MQKRLKQIYMYTCILAIGLALSAFFWLPALYESKYINKDLFANTYLENFPTVGQLVYSPWGFGPNVNEVGGLSPQIGFLYVGLVIVTVLTLVKKRKINKEFVFWLIILAAAVFLETRSSSFFWEKIVLLQKLQFPWRFTALSSFASVMVASFLLRAIKDKKFNFAIFALIIITSFSLAKVSGFTAKRDSYYLAFKGTPYHHGEATTIWTAGDPEREAQQLIEVIDGEANVSEILRKSNRHTFVVNAKTQSRILDNTIYFPGWRVEVDGKKVPIEFQDQNHRGLITFAISQGQHKIKVKFGESPIRLISDIISASTLIFVIVIFIFRKRIERYLIKI